VNVLSGFMELSADADFWNTSSSPLCGFMEHQWFTWSLLRLAAVDGSSCQLPLPLAYARQ